jgi:long-chain fatty acid transport protein
MWAKNKIVNAVDQSLLGANDARMNIEADGGGWGYNLGLLYRSRSNWAVGLAYRNGISIEQQGTLELTGIATAMQPLFGGSSFRTSVRTTTDFPEIADLGLAYRPTERWLVDVDMEWVGWSSFQRATLDLENEVPAAGVTDISVAQDWHDSWAYKIGGEYRLNHHLFVRTGYAYLGTSVPEKTLTAGNPDANQQNFSVGIGWHKVPWTVDGFYNFGAFRKRHVTNTILSGAYETRVHYLGVSVGYQL